MRRKTCAKLDVVLLRPVKDQYSIVSYSHHMERTACMPQHVHSDDFSCFAVSFLPKPNVTSFLLRKFLLKRSIRIWFLTIPNYTVTITTVLCVKVDCLYGC